MALGTLTASSPVGQEGGPISMHRVSFAGDDSYPTGGTPFQDLARAALGKGNIEILAVVQQNLSDHVCRFDIATGNLTVQVMGSGAEVGNGTDLSSTTFELLVIAR